MVGTETIRHYIAETHPLWNKRDLAIDDMREHTKTWVDIISRDRAALGAEIFNEENKQIARIRSYANNLNAAVLILRSGTSIVPLPAEYLESRQLDFKCRSLSAVFPQYSVKVEVAIRRDFLNASPAARFILEQLPRFSTSRSPT